MPRKQFVADLKEAKDGPLPSTIHDLRQGEDDGQIQFTVLVSGEVTESVRLTALIPDLSGYPSNHAYMIFSDDGTSPQAAAKLEKLNGYHGKTVFEMLELIATALANDCHDQDADVTMKDSQDDDLEEDDSDVDIYDSDDEAFSRNGSSNHFGSTQTTRSAISKKPIDAAFRRRIHGDLTRAKHSGFKVGHLGHLMAGTNAYVTIAVRIAKLGLSQEAMEAWKVDPNEYLMLIIQYPDGYKTNEELQSMNGSRTAANVSMRMVAGKRYKPTLQEAIRAFAISKKDTRDEECSHPQEPTDSSIREVFISNSINNLLQERLIPLLRYRSTGMDWRGAEEFFAQVFKTSSIEAQPAPDWHFEPEPPSNACPAIVNADHYKQAAIAAEISFPLLAMQFVIRHFVRCTEFCLVCHDHLRSNFEAIKPYVCDKPLCLYQYMTLGFGPSIEHEILTQPYVVDLLVSFCYSSAKAGKIKEFPDGLAIMAPFVPKLDTPNHARYQAAPAARNDPQDAVDSKLKVSELVVGFDVAFKEIIFRASVPATCPVKRGSWIILKRDGQDTEYHCRVADATYYPTITIDEPVRLSPLSGLISSGNSKDVNFSLDLDDSRVSSNANLTRNYVDAKLQLYDQDFDQLSKGRKRAVICRLLETLPNVKAMQQRLKKGDFNQLKDWVDRISPSALSLLRWIIASNRACIMQVDGDSEDGTSTTWRDRVHGMPNYMQFRFAMGAPDKEQRFMKAVHDTTDRLKLQFPTIFAWHGSPLQNWHTIIREGLHFENIDHGRAYGHGVYHAKDAGTSSGYSGMAGVIPSWPNSVLRISSAIALNEIVNAPLEFQSRNPYYVVQQLDWIQTRYLFVHCAPTVDNLQIREGIVPKQVFQQDSTATPKGLGGEIVIPETALKSRKKVAEKNTSEGFMEERATKKIKTWHNSGTEDSPIPVDDSDPMNSDTTDDEDVRLLRDDPELQHQPVVKAMMLADSDTDYEPGKLDFGTLPMMPMPTYATTATTRRLMKELQNLAQTQNTTPIADLGWYIDVEKIDNVYQWIVELHSFHKLDPQLPMVKEMKDQNVKSIVLEVRFNKDFPFTPPYIRVIRPRFLTFAQGGGGHIVMGGALCMELLTNTGWSSVSTMESVFMQVRLAIGSKPFARLEPRGSARAGSSRDYGAAEAADGYIRACASHGWQVPPGFREMAYGVKQE